MASRRRTGRYPTPEEERLWERAMGDAHPLRKSDSSRAAPLPPRSARSQGDARPHAKTATETSRPAPASPQSGGLAGLDARGAMRLRRGRWPLDGRIDLHGMTLREAEDTLQRYLVAAAAAGKRCILVITGKGAPPPLPHERDYMPDKPRPGAIRGALPRWLTEGPAATHVLAYHPARARHGGAGAFYVLLRRRRGG